MLIKITHQNDASILGCISPIEIGRGMWLVNTVNTQDVKYVVMMLVKAGRAEIVCEM